MMRLTLFVINWTSIEKMNNTKTETIIWESPFTVIISLLKNPDDIDLGLVKDQAIIKEVATKLTQLDPLALTQAIARYDEVTFRVKCLDEKKFRKTDFVPFLTGEYIFELVARDID